MGGRLFPQRARRPFVPNKGDEARQLPRGCERIVWVRRIAQFKTRKVLRRSSPRTPSMKAHLVDRDLDPPRETVGPRRANPLHRKRWALPMGWPGSAPRARARRRRHRRGYRAASRSRAVTVSLADAAARYAQDRGIVSTNRTASILHGPAISVGSRSRCRGSARARALGMGHQRLCLRVERDPSDPASDEPGI
jgi:hypothetical protein